MLRTQPTIHRLVRLCLNPSTQSHYVPRVRFQESPTLKPAFRWYSSSAAQTNPTTSTDHAADAVKERKLKILQMEASVLRQEGRRVPDPDRMKPDQWEHLLGLETKSARSKYYSFLWSNEMKRESEKVG